MAGYTIQSFGCRSSAADGESIGEALRQLGASPATGPEAAELIILNTCAVTAQAEADARAAIRRARRRNPAARIVVTGCYAQRAPEQLRALEGVSLVVGNSHKALVAEAALGAGAAQHGWVAASSLAQPQVLHTPFASRLIAGEHAAEAKGALALPQAGAGARTRPVVRVQEGCGNRCSFCVIPETRGPSRSLPAEAILRTVRRLVDDGVQEVVLSGINLGRWGRDLSPAACLPALVSLLLEHTGLPRLRLSSIEPMDWDDALLELFSQYAQGAMPRLAPHAHLPLQSGSDAILRRMHRRYRPWHYAEKLATLKGLLPEAALGADIMVGFPGETDKLFEDSFSFVERQPLTYLHLFPFSPRPGTAAAEWHRTSPVPSSAVRERMRALEVLGRAKHRQHMAQGVGQTVSAVTLKGGHALTANFLPVRLQESMAPNRLLPLRLASIEGDMLVAARDR